tara:strand:+ start:295 stop:600 length:306 start_codon:yes stop_codon:yes gene_type:complete
MKEALKEILRIVQTNGGLNKGDEINITYCSGLWRIEEIAKHALRKEAQANARLIASAPELLEQCKLFEKLLTVMIMEGDSGADLERDNLRAILDRVEGESA